MLKAGGYGVLLTWDDEDWLSLGDQIALGYYNYRTGQWDTQSPADPVAHRGRDGQGEDSVPDALHDQHAFQLLPCHPNRLHHGKLLLSRKDAGDHHYTYECDEFIDGIQIADKLSLPHEKVFKTLVTRGNGRDYFVFVIPVDRELDLKKAARAVGEKSVAMIPVKDINGITGYIRGGCTAVGMKKQYVTRLDECAGRQETIVISGGRIGAQIELRPGKEGYCGFHPSCDTPDSFPKPFFSLFCQFLFHFLFLLRFRFPKESPHNQISFPDMPHGPTEPAGI